MGSTTMTTQMDGEMPESTQNLYSDDSRESAFLTAIQQEKDIDPETHRMSQLRLAELSDQSRINHEKEEQAVPSLQSPMDETELAMTPITARNSPNLLPSAPETVNGTSPPASDKLSLLLVDDNVINLRLLTTYAERNKHPYAAASDGAEAVRAYSNAVAPSPEVIFMDINMPVMDGFEATRRIRELEKQDTETKRAATIVALTGLGSDDAKDQARASGIDIFLTKPIRPRELKILLEKLSEERARS